MQCFHFFPAFVTTLLRDMNFSPWIGLVKQSDGTIRWVDNNDVTYTNWYQGEPNGIRGVVSVLQLVYIYCPVLKNIAGR